MAKAMKTSIKNPNNPNGIKTGDTVKMGEGYYTPGVENGRVYTVEGIGGEMSNRIKLVGIRETVYAFMLAKTRSQDTSLKEIFSRKGVIFSTAAR